MTRFALAVILCTQAAVGSQAVPAIAGACAKGTVPVPLFIVPVGGVLSSTFRPRLHPILGVAKLHTGWDIVAPKGSPVRASLAGTVTSVGTDAVSGNFVKVSHADGLVTVYVHLDRFAPGLRKGSHVAAGELLGFVGNTGLSTKPHLHYEVRLRGIAIDPARFFCAPAIPSSGANPPQHSSKRKHHKEKK